MARGEQYKMNDNQIITEIIFPKDKYIDVVNHCLRKLNRNYYPEEFAQQQAYGLIGGNICEHVLSVNQVAPLLKNSRISDEPLKNYMDNALDKYAIPSKVPNEERAWAADPLEAKVIVENFEKNHLQLIGTYHMHHMASWSKPELRELPTDLDRKLAEDTELFMFIVVVANPQQPVLRAFFEGCIEKEIKIKID